MTTENEINNFWNSLNKFPEEITKTIVVEYNTRGIDLYEAEQSQKIFSTSDMMTLNMMALVSVAKDYDCCYVTHSVYKDSDEDFIPSGSHGDFIFDLSFHGGVDDGETEKYSKYNKYNPLCPFNEIIKIKSNGKRVDFKSVTLRSDKHQEFLRLVNH